MLAIGIISVFLSTFAAWGLERLISHERVFLQLPPTPRTTLFVRPALVTIAILAGWCILNWCELDGNMLDTPEVQPSELSRRLRVVYHAALALALVLATVIDFDCYVIPDAITVPGMLVGVIGAVAVQELQIAHLWVDWSYAIPQLRGPYIPEWYSRMPWLHALAWSVTGLLVGGGLTQIVRVISRMVLGMEAMGFGDVTLMAMIGSFLGWQAVVLTFVIAPITGLVIAIVGNLVFRVGYLPYGPYLSAAAFLVLMFWRLLWQETRGIFSDFIGLAMLAGAAVIGLTLLLGALRLYRSIPTRG